MQFVVCFRDAIFFATKMHSAIFLAPIFLIIATTIAATTATGFSINSGQSGVCVSTGSCKSGGGESEAGHCPGAADIQVGRHAHPFKTADAFGLTLRLVLHIWRLYCLGCRRTMSANKLLQRHIDTRIMSRSNWLSVLPRFWRLALRNSHRQFRNSDLDQRI